MSDAPSTFVREAGSGNDLCQTCAHPLPVHDAISLRWCAATQLGVGRRACICSGVVAEARVLTHY